MSATPPQIPRETPRESAWIIYVRAMGFLVPGILTMVFSRLVLVPKMNRLFELTHEDWDRAVVGHWLEKIANFVPSSWPVLIGGAAAFFVLFEMKWSRWPRYRGAVVMICTVLFNGMVMFGMVAIASSMGICGPMAGLKMAKEKSATEPRQSLKPAL